MSEKDEKANLESEESRDAKLRKEAEEARREAKAGEHAVGDRKLRCPHCGNDTFETQSVLLNTRGLTFFNLDWLNKSATAYCCTSCGLIQWFLERS